MNKTLILVVEDDRPMTINIWLQKTDLQLFWKLRPTIRILFFWIWGFLIWKG